MVIFVTRFLYFLLTSLYRRPTDLKLLASLVVSGMHPDLTRGYMHVRTTGYICAPTLSIYGEVDPFCPTRTFKWNSPDLEVP